MTENLLSLAASHRATSREFTEKVDRVRDWDAPTPVKEWVARDVVRHVVEWLRGMLADAVELAEIPSVDEDPASAWKAHDAQIQALLEDPATSGLKIANGTPVLQAIEQYYVPDVFMHTWDLARSAGLKGDLDPVVCQAMLDGMRPMEEQLRASGHFGEQQAVRPGASPEDQLVAFIGRDPYWMPPKKA